MGLASFNPTFREKEEKLSLEMYYIYKVLLESGQKISETFKKKKNLVHGETHEKDTDPDLSKWVWVGFDWV